VKGLSLSKQYAFSGIDVSDFQGGTIQVKTENELPLDAYLQIYFLNNAGVVLDSVSYITNPY